MNSKTIKNCMTALSLLLLLLAASCGGRQSKTSESPDSKKPADILTIFIKVLTSEITHTDAESKRTILFKDYCNDNGLEEKYLRFAIVDLDGDGIPEIVLEHPHGIIRILRYENGTVYGFTFSNRAMNNIKKDGTFEW
jgi:hypothetical protein